MAFVHLHNHSDFSILDAATRIPDMVKKAGDEGMPAIALTDHGYMFGIPNFDLECRNYNDDCADAKQWRHDRECYQKGWELEEPEPDAPDAPVHQRAHAQWERDVAAWEASHDLAALDATIAAVEGLPEEEFTTPAIEAALQKALIEDLELKPRKAFGPIRVAVTGAQVSPPLFESMELLGREKSLARLKTAREVTPWQSEPAQ